MKIDLSVLKIVSTCIVISLSFVLLAFSLIGVLTNVHAAIASPTDHPSLASLPTTPTPTPIHKHKHKHILMPPSTVTTPSIATPTALPALTNNSMTSQDSRSPFTSALAGTLISAGVALLVSILFLRILLWRQRNKSSHGDTDNNLLLIESQETLPFNDIFPPTDDTPAPTNQPQTAFNNVFLPTNGPLDPAHQPQISFSDMFLPTNGPFDPAHQPQTASNGMFPSDPRNLPTRS